MKKVFWQRLGYLLAVGILFYASYGFSNWFSAQRESVAEIAFAWEKDIPFLAWTIVPYWSLNAMYALAFFLARSKPELQRYVAQLVMAQIIAVACFLLFPLQFSWQKPPTEGLSGLLFNSLTAFDQPYNQAPSLHIILTVIVGTFYWCYLPKIWRGPLLIWLGLIALSVLTTYQHHFIDIPTGTLVGYLILWALPYESSSLLRGQQADGFRLKQMKYYLVGAFVALLPALYGDGWLWFIWVSVALLLVAYVYAWSGTNAFQKRDNGRHSVAATILFLPYQIGVRLNMLYWLRHQAKASEVLPGIFIGSITQAAKFEAVVDLCAEYPCFSPPKDYVSIPMLDMVPPESAELARAAQEIERLRKARQTVLVCCALGYGRSAAAMLVWLTVYGGCENLPNALQQLRLARPRVVLFAGAEKNVLSAIHCLQKKPKGIIRKA
ncbi:phosphatase PAP2/dual specificity phosphatase family protein [Aggregatibacter actinomycetemcomitans]|uniref:phosphatase PAP2/dual specificity phosphatase family protein n=1 Tax=Aggregatibacter actinomycetemcomitans TaxID=714 RepID=UPI00197BB46E|nr:phosphatase PAP2/dual specificity phosphatase family protein [Aggregatibacter actinomycetemcomitans]MBN6076624.1 phosphatase PAP2/dual specificity phosphatase family protein [Aggregatibacter actinomycetemcomitans]